MLQTAAVIGKEFTQGILAAVAELPEPELAEALGALRASEFVYQRSLYPEAEFVFKHPLTQEVALETQLQDRLHRTHCHVAEALEEVHAAKLDQQAALIAHHWESAQESMQAARWHRRAAEWVGASDLTQATRHWRKVRALVGDVSESTETVELQLAACTAILDLGWRLGLSDAETAALFSEGRELAACSSDPRVLALFLDGYATVLRLHGDLEGSRQIEREAVQAAEEAGDAAVRVAVRLYLPYANLLAGRLRDSLRISEEILADASDADLAMAARFKKLDPYVHLRMMKGRALSEIGRLNEAKSELDRAVELARERGDLENLGWAHDFQVHRAWLACDGQTALRHARSSAEVAERVGSAFSRRYASQCLGLAYIVNEEWNQASDVLEATLASARQGRIGLEQEARLLSDLGEALLGCGKPGQALAAAEEAVDTARRRGTPVLECDAHRVLARVLLHTEGRSSEWRIQAALESALELAERTGARSREPFIRDEYAELAGLLGDDATRERELREAHRLYTEMGATGHAQRLAAELGL